MTLKVSVYGDSISTFVGFTPDGWRLYYEEPQLTQTGVMSPEDTWWMQVAHAMGGEYFTNAAFSGCCVGGVGFPSAWVPTRIAPLLKDGEQPDVVLVYVGINDYGWGGSLNQVNGRTLSMPPAALELGIPAQESYDAVPGALEEFSYCYSVMLHHIRKACPNAEVWAITLCPGRWMGSPVSTFMYSVRGIAFQDYNQAIKDAAQRCGCKVADIASLGLDYEGIDGTHPTKLGMQQMSAMIMKTMGLPLDDVHQAALDSCPPSANTCDKADCIYCPHAKGVRNKWWLVCNRDFSTE